MLAQGLVLWWTGLYKGLWRFASLPDLWNIVRAGVVGCGGDCRCAVPVQPLGPVPRAVLVIYPVVLVVFLGTPRLAYRYWKDSRLGLGRTLIVRRVLVLGAGRAGEALVRELVRENRYRPVGLLDDNAALRGAKVHGVPVLGTLMQLPELSGEVAAEMLLIAMPSATQCADAARRRTVREGRHSVPHRAAPAGRALPAG